MKASSIPRPVIKRNRASSAISKKIARTTKTPVERIPSSKVLPEIIEKIPDSKNAMRTMMSKPYTIVPTRSVWFACCGKASFMK